MIRQPRPVRPSGRRIVFVIEKLAMRSGGAERVLIETANALAARGHEVEILSHEPRGKGPFYDTAPGVMTANLMSPRSGWRAIVEMIRSRLTFLPDYPVLDRIVGHARDGGFVRRLRRHLRATRPDVAIAFMPPAISALARARVDHPMRRVASMHNAPEQDFQNPERWNHTRLDQRRRLRLMSHMDRIAVLLPEYRDWYRADLRPAVCVLPNAVTPRAPSDAVRERVVMAVGRLATVKRHDLLLDCWKTVAPDFPDWHLRIWGDGPLKDQLATRIAEERIPAVTLMGHRTDVSDHYQTAAILAHPAEFEGFPLAVTESLAAGLPVVGFADCSGLNRLVEDGVNGVLVPNQPSRHEAFARELAKVMRDDALRAAMSAAGPASMAPYAPDRVIDLWEEILFADAVPCASA